MQKEEQSVNWYELWTKQSKDFFDTAEKNLKGAFENPEENITQIRQWMETLKTQWQFMELNHEQQKIYSNYWKIIEKMCNEASELMLKQWIQRAHDDNPIKDSRDLYELWLSCCQEIYAKSMHSESYRKAYGEMMNSMLNYWKAAIPK